MQDKLKNFIDANQNCPSLLKFSNTDLLEETLKKLGYLEYEISKTNKDYDNLRYTTEIDRDIDIINSSENITGKLIKIIIKKNNLINPIKLIHIVKNNYENNYTVPEWSCTKTKQVVSRVVRTSSHKEIDFK